ncbi:hypothetical protein HYV86_03545 [Candidatus Woesearchaeota archaeon]|nr:hypothetical protein [Candidatus Woesearchaeota archaeon]
MEISSLPILKQDERGTIYDLGGKAKYIVRKQGSISGDHMHNVEEILFLLNGKVELTLGNVISIVEAPVKISIPAHTHHKLLAITSIELVEFRDN